jgi:CheY-like chemotaxis protein/anti-sigma regulatory factor (Ser/Thr protein kinase)
MAAGVSVKIDKKFTDLPKISGNPSALREAFTNLVFNAVDAMPQGGTITFEAKTEPHVVRLEVSDTGSGMSEEVRRHCFDPFFSTKGTKGTGLGLAMVYGVIRRHEGTVDIKSEPGKGTTFIIRLPQYIGARHLAVTAEGAPAARPPRPAKSLRCLLVDDEASVRAVMREYLASEGHTVETATSGADALEKYEPDKYDLVVTDWAMPGMSGDRLAIRLKELSASLPIIMLTGFGELIKAKGEQPAGVDVLISKPPTLDAVREAIVQVFAVS